MVKDMYFKIPIEIYVATLHVYFGDADKFNVILKRNGMKSIKPGTAVGLAGIRGDDAIIWLYTKPINADGYDSLAHEVFHAAYRLLKNRGYKLTLTSQEPLAYLIGFMTKKIYQKLYPEKKKKKK